MVEHPIDGMLNDGDSHIVPESSTTAMAKRERLVFTLWESPLSFGRAKNFERPVEGNFSYN
jgi:hypothetical protein